MLERAKLGVERWCGVVDKKSNGQKKKLRRKVGTTKAGRKKTSRTNIISKDFFRAQLINLYPSQAIYLYVPEFYKTY